MNLIEEYEEETRNNAYWFDICNQRIYADKYVEWLENKLNKKKFLINGFDFSDFSDCDWGKLADTLKESEFCSTNIKNMFKNCQQKSIYTIGMKFKLLTMNDVFKLLDHSANKKIWYYRNINPLKDLIIQITEEDLRKRIGEIVSW